MPGTGGVATGVVTDDPRLTGQFCYRNEVRLGQPVAMRDSDVQASGEHDLVLESGEVVIGQASADADDGDAQTAGLSCRSRLGVSASLRLTSSPGSATARRPGCDGGS